jgi:hypothetical protein
MSKLISTDKEYAAWVADLKHRFRSAQIKAAVKVNRELLIYYWQLGRDMVNMNIEERWGEGIMKTLSQDLKDAMPEENGFSKTNLYYIKKFYTTYSQIVINFPQVGGKIETPHSVQFLPQVGEKEQDIAEMLFSIPWTHHKFILDKIKGDVQKGLFFVAKGKRFTFDEQHFFVDLVFYNRLLQCYVLIDLKMGKLTHQDLGQMQMYVNYYDRHMSMQRLTSSICPTKPCCKPR